MPFSLPLGELFVVLTGEAEGFEKMLKSAEKRMKGVATTFISLGTRMTAFVTAPLVALGTSSIKAASDAKEIESKFGIVFSNVIDDARRFSQELEKSYGLATAESQDLLSDTGLLIQSMGFLQKESLDMSNALQKSAADWAAFKNVVGGTDRVSRAFTRSLLGERETLKALGIAVNENSDEFKSLLKQIKQTEGVTLDQAKALTTINLIFKKTATATGTFQREQGNLASQVRLLLRDYANFRVEIGKELIPMALRAVAVFREWFTEWRALDNQTKRNIINVAKFAAILGPTLILIGLLIKAAAILVALGIKGIAVNLAWAVSFLIIAAAIALVTDAILQMTGQGNLGILDLVQNFRIGGRKISTIFQIAALSWTKLWLFAITQIKVAWLSFELLNLRVVIGIQNAFLKTAKFIAKVLIRGIQLALPANLGRVFARQFSQGIARVDSFFEKSITKNTNFMLDKWGSTFDALAKLDKDFKEDVAIIDKTILDTLEADSKERKKFEVPGVTDAPKVPEIPRLKVDDLEVKDQSFEVINLKRFSLEGPGGLAQKTEQNVKAKGVEDRLDTLIGVTKNSRSVARLG